MAKYIVVDGHKKINGKLVSPGDIVECDAETAQRLRLTSAPEGNPEPSRGKKDAGVRG